MPFPEIILRQSVIKLESEQTIATFRAFEKIYPDWKKMADAGKYRQGPPPSRTRSTSLEAMIRHGKQ
jgi:hypothetical protein